MNRRKFLGSANCAALSSVGGFNTLVNLRMISNSVAASAPAGPDDYRAFVCLFLHGGNDSFNMLVPSDNDRYGEYAGVRADLALPQADLLQLNCGAVAWRLRSYGRRRNFPDGTKPPPPKQSTIFRRAQGETENFYGFEQFAG